MEILEYIAESDKAMLTASWWATYLDRIKKFPKKPSELWSSAGTKRAQTEDEMFSTLMAYTKKKSP